MPASLPLRSVTMPWWRASQQDEREYFERASKEYALIYRFDSTFDTVGECALNGKVAVFLTELLARAPPLTDVRNALLFQTLINEFFRHEKGHSIGELDSKCLTGSIAYFKDHPQELRLFLEALDIFGIEITNAKFLSTLRYIYKKAPTRMFGMEFRFRVDDQLGRGRDAEFSLKERITLLETIICSIRQNSYYIKWDVSDLENSQRRPGCAFEVKMAGPVSYTQSVLQELCQLFHILQYVPGP